jgi:hypothetical protein
MWWSSLPAHIHVTVTPLTGRNKTVSDNFAFALRYDGRKRVHDADYAMGRITADRFVMAGCLPTGSISAWPEGFGVSVEAGQAIRMVEFLWASLALFDDDTAAPTDYRPLHLDLYQVAEARERILRRLADAPEGQSLDRLLPDPPDIPESEARGKLRRRSTRSSTLIAGLELAKQEDELLDVTVIHGDGTTTAQEAEKRQGRRLLRPQLQRDRAVRLSAGQSQRIAAVARGPSRGDADRPSGRPGSSG